MDGNPYEAPEPLPFSEPRKRRKLDLVEAGLTFQVVSLVSGIVIAFAALAASSLLHGHLLRWYVHASIAGLLIAWSGGPVAIVCFVIESLRGRSQ